MPTPDTCIKEQETTAEKTVIDSKQILAKRAVEKTENLDLPPSAPVTAPRKPIQVPDTVASLHPENRARVQEFGDQLLECWRDFDADDAPADWADPKLRSVNHELVKMASDWEWGGLLHPEWADRIFQEVRAARLRDNKPIRDVASFVNYLTRRWLGRQFQYKDLSKAPPRKAGSTL